MTLWLFIEWYCSLCGGGVIPRDARHRYVSRAGVAYEVLIEQVAGVMNIVQVTLRGDSDRGGVIPNTSLPGLTVIVRPTALRVGAAIRYLLHEADHQSRQQQRLAERFPVAIAPESELTEAQADALADRLAERVYERVTAPSAEELAEE